MVAFSDFTEKPPLFIWFQVLSMKLFGINAMAARLPNAIIGAFTLSSIYTIGCKYKGHFFGIMWVLAYACMPAFLYFKSGLIDPTFNLFILLAAVQLQRIEFGTQNFSNTRIHAFLFGVFAALAVLSKGPVALLILGIIWVSRILFSLSSAWQLTKQMVLAAFSFVLVCSIWIIPLIANHGTAFFEQFYAYHLELASGFIDWHKQPWYYHLVVLLIICFPASIFCWPAMFKRYSINVASYENTIKTLFVVVLVIFSIVNTKIIHYSSLCWYAISFFAAIYFYNQYTNIKAEKKRYLGWGLLLIGLPMAILIAALPFAQKIIGKDKLLPLKLDEFTTNQLAVKIEWSPWLAIIGGALMLLIILFTWAQLRKKNNAAWFNIAVVCLITWQLVYYLLLPGVQMHTQKAMNTKMKQIAAEGGLQHSWDFKSYAQYFYGKLMPHDLQLKQADGQVVDYRNKDKYTWITEVSSKTSNRPYYLWVKNTKLFSNDGTWQAVGQYNGYHLFKKKR